MTTLMTTQMNLTNTILTVPHVHIPRVQHPQIQQAQGRQLYIPQIHRSQVQIPQVQTPQINIPQIQRPQVRIPQVHPQVQIPQVHPQVQIPIVKTNVIPATLPTIVPLGIPSSQKMIPIPNLTVPHVQIPVVNLAKTNVIPETLPTIVPLTVSPARKVIPTPSPKVPNPSPFKVPVPKSALPNVPKPQLPKPPLPNVPNTNVPNTKVPNTKVPHTNVPNTKVPNTKVPHTNVPNTNVPNTNVPNTNVPNTNVPNTNVPNTRPITNMVLIPGPKRVKELQLRPWQIDWANRAQGILLRNHGYIDTSRMRSGKTYVTLWLAKQFGFRLLIICPVIAIDVWRRTAAEYGVEVIDIISYQSLRSQKNHQPKHGYLNRFDNITDGGMRHVSFTPSREYLELVEQGILVICDEIQNIKNNSDQYKACNTLLNPIISGGGRSRFGLLSGTPFDKQEHAVNLLRLIGYIRAYRLYSYDRKNKELILEGMQELIDACRFINMNETERVLAEIPLAKGKMNDMCYSLFTRVVKSNISGAMAAPTDIRGVFDVKNGFYIMTEETAQRLQNAISELANAVRFNERTGTAEIRAENIGAVTTALVHVENAKILEFARIATMILMANETNKVVISVNYISTMDEIRNLLLMYNPLILNGKIAARKRGDIVRAFTDDPTRRLLIMNTAVGGVGISLYSTQPNSDVHMLMSPSYKLLDVTQAAARIYGPGMISDAFVRMVYGRGAGTLETSILTALARKTEVLKGTLEDIVTRDLILPGDYPSVEEKQ